MRSTRTSTRTSLHRRRPTRRPKVRPRCEDINFNPGAPVGTQRANWRSHRPAHEPARAEQQKAGERTRTGNPWPQSGTARTSSAVRSQLNPVQKWGTGCLDVSAQWLGFLLEIPPIAGAGPSTAWGDECQPPPVPHTSRVSMFTPSFGNQHARPP